MTESGRHRDEENLLRWICSRIAPAHTQALNDASTACIRDTLAVQSEEVDWKKTKNPRRGSVFEASSP